jgi:hypothetical protein
MPGSRITWVIGCAVVALIVVAGIDARRSPDDKATASATTAVTTTPFTPTTTVVTDVDDEAAERTNFVKNQDPEDWWMKPATRCLPAAETSSRSASRLFATWRRWLFRDASSARRPRLSSGLPLLSGRPQGRSRSTAARLERAPSLHRRPLPRSTRHPPTLGRFPVSRGRCSPRS